MYVMKFHGLPNASPCLDIFPTIQELDLDVMKFHPLPNASPCPDIFTAIQELHLD